MGNPITAFLILLLSYLCKITRLTFQ